MDKPMPINYSFKAEIVTFIIMFFSVDVDLSVRGNVSITVPTV